MASIRHQKPSMSPVAVFLLSLLLIIILHLQNQCIRAHHQHIPDDPLDFDEREALVTLNTTLPHTTNINFTWSPSEPACSWKGVYCYSEKNFTTVLHLRLPAKSFVGQIPLNSIGKLTSLRVLSLRQNGFSGNIPSDFSNLTSLTRLSLSNNRFTGPIPDYFSNFKKLNVLALDNNRFTGNLPDIKAKGLEKFNVSVNNLNSRIPPSLSKFGISVFSENVFLCGEPTPNKCNSSYPPVVPEKKKKNMTPLIVGVSVGSGLILLVLLSRTQKVYKQPEQRPLQAGKGEGYDFVLFDDSICGLDMEKLLKASAVFIGEGSVGRSYKQVLEGESTTVVMKRLIKDVVVTENEFKKTMDDLKEVVVTENEFKKTMDDLGKMKNKNVVRLLAYCYSKYEKWLIYDYMRGGSLYDRLHGGQKHPSTENTGLRDEYSGMKAGIKTGSITSKRRQLDWDHLMRIALSSARGLEYLHAENVIHGNIKSSNILIQQETNSEASVADYGLNTLFHGSSSQNDQRAPEVCDTLKVTFEFDVYSFGVVLLELLTGQIPKQELSNKEVPFLKWVKLIVCAEPREIFDVDLMKDHNEGMMQLFEIAKYCVSSVPDDQNSRMRVVVSKMEDMWFRQSSDDHSKGYDDTPSTDTRDTPSTITP